jgi:hemerythrin-like domain-containing protein
MPGKASGGVGRLTVNAAFLKEIKDDNRQLKTLWDQLVPLVNHVETARNHWPELIAGLAELRDQLAIHFSLEEAYGYFDEAIDIAPHHSLQAESLRGQHSTLFEMIRDLADAITDVDPDREEKVSQLLKRFVTFQDAFKQHEEAELKMILDSFDDDIGVGD